MTIETASRINSAACAAWLFEHGISTRLAKEDVRLLQSLSVGQVQTAADIIEAVNAAAKSEDGKRSIACVLDAGSAELLKRFVDSLSLED